MSADVEQAVRLVNETPGWLRVDWNVTRAGRRYPWHSQEDAELKRCWGRMPRAETARRVSRALQEVTGDPAARRTICACNCRAGELALAAYDGEADEMPLKRAARVCGLSYHVLHKAATDGSLATRRKGKQRYVLAGEWEVWLARYWERKAAQARVAAQVGGESISKQEAMSLTGLHETQICRYLRTGVIRGWKVPDLKNQRRGTWRVSRASVMEYIQSRAEGRLAALLNGTPAYVALRERMGRQVRELRRAGRIKQTDPLTEPKSRYHPGCFTVAQVASHVDLPASVVYEAIKAGQVQSEVGTFHSRMRYAIQPEEARRYAALVARWKAAGVTWSSRQRRQIAKAGLLTVRDLAQHWGVTEETVKRQVRAGGLAYRTWGRYLVFEPKDVAEFERNGGHAAQPDTLPGGVGE